MSEPTTRLPQPLEPLPLPLALHYGSARMNDGQGFVLLSIAQPGQVSTYWLPVGIVDEVCAKLQHEAQRANSGLIVPRVVPPTDLGDGQRPPDG